ncbi:RHO1 GDP-GTP exchange protein 2 [Gaertneriomyces sp. JEL0708]|nr:RHO1 GDP-GTP exchange protein 2 [Gaertneriomyces sp. JEL0708]
MLPRPPGPYPVVRVPVYNGYVVGPPPAPQVYRPLPMPAPSGVDQRHHAMEGHQPMVNYSGMAGGSPSAYLPSGNQLYGHREPMNQQRIFSGPMYQPPSHQRPHQPEFRRVYFHPRPVTLQEAPRQYASEYRYEPPVQPEQQLSRPHWPPPAAELPHAPDSRPYQQPYLSHQHSAPSLPHLQMSPQLPRTSSQRYSTNSPGPVSPTNSGAPSRRSSSSQAPLHRVESAISPAPVRRSSEISSTHTSHVPADPVYPALLSEVARAFRDRIQIGTYLKDSLEYKDCFPGRAGVDMIGQIVRTTDRNLALLLGRALDSQKFFHDVTYNHRLRDSVHELYQFQSSFATPIAVEIPDTTVEADEDLPNGVFTLLTDCYSPTCSREQLCYSIACPRRMEQQARLLKQTNSQLQRSPSRTSLSDADAKGALWSTSVSKEIVDTVSNSERKRQEIIFEAIQTEREFVDDLELIKKVFIEPLRQGGIIDPERADSFIQEVFLNIDEIHKINAELLRRLLARQKECPVVEKIGDVFLSFANEFEAYVEYGARQAYAKHTLDQERTANPEFNKFLQDCERRPECRKLPIQSFLGRPTTRMGRYPLFLRSVVDKAAPNNPDRTLVPQAMDVIKTILSKINKEAGEAENRLKLSLLQAQLTFNPGELVDLALDDPARVAAREGALILRKGGNEIDLQVFLFDHALLLTKKKKNGTYKVYKRPIPLELLLIADPGMQRRSSGIFSGSGLTHAGSIKQPPPLPPVAIPDTKGSPFTLIHLGRSNTAYTLYAANQADRRSWKEAIEAQKSSLTLRKRKFEVVTLLDSEFSITNRVTCSVPHGNQLIIGADNGVYVGPAATPAEQDAGPRYRRVLNLEKVAQLEVLPECGILTVLAEKHLSAFPLDVVESQDSDAASATLKGRRIASHVSFFKQGVCDNRTLVTAVKLTTLSSRVKVFEPQAFDASKKKGFFNKLSLPGQEAMKTYKEFYIPTESSSIHYLKTKLCVGCTKGFEIVDLETLETQGLLDPTDPSLDFVLKKESLRPLSIFRIQDGDFLLCYNDFGFYVDKFGRRTKHELMLHWSGQPTAFAFVPPYVLAFEPAFIEVRDVNSTALQQIIPTNNLRALNTAPDVLHCVMESPLEYQHIFKLKQVAE